MGQLAQILGALLILAAFALAQLGVLDQRSNRYLVANLVGASVLALDAWLESQLGFLVLEAAWAIVSAWVTTSRLRPSASCRSTWVNGSSREPQREEVRRTPFATARTSPCERVSRVMMRSASPSLWVRSTTASSR